MADEFSALLADLEKLQTNGETMAKALDAAEDKAGDKKIAAAAGEAGEAGGDDTAAGGADTVEGAEGGEGETFGKSFRVVLEDGSEAEAYDGTEMMKALHADIDTLKAEGTALKAERDTLAKALGTMTAVLKAGQDLQKQQSEMLKSLQGDVASLRGAGAGRKAMLSVHDKPAPGAGAAEPKQQIDRKTFMAKAISLMGKGLVSGQEISGAEALLNSGRPLPEEFVNRVIAA